MPVLLRPDGAVQVGWDPRRAVLVRPPGGLAAAALATLLRSMWSPTPLPELQRRARDHGLTDADGLTNLVAQLVGAGVATECGRGRGRAASVRIHGRGPLSELLVETLRCSGARITHSSQPHAAVSADDVDLVVLSDYLVADPRMVRDLQDQGVAHLLVRVRDGVGVGGSSGDPRRHQLPGMCGSASQGPRRGVAGDLRTAAGNRRRRRSGHRAGDGGAGAVSGEPGDRGGAWAGDGVRARTAPDAERHPGIRSARRRHRHPAVGQASVVSLLSRADLRPGHVTTRVVVLSAHRAGHHG